MVACCYMIDRNTAECLWKISCKFSGRAWLYTALNEQLLESYLRCYMNNPKLINKYYAKEALVQDHQVGNNSLAPGKFEWNFRYLIFQIISVIDGWGISCELALRWMSLDLSDNKSTLVQVMAWCRQATSHYLNQCWPRSSMPYGITRSQWVNTLWPRNAIWQYRSGSTFAQVMACCLTAPSDYLNQCWLTISDVQWHSSKCNFIGDSAAINH